jgi:hypothetical protein
VLVAAGVAACDKPEVRKEELIQCLCARTESNILAHKAVWEVIWVFVMITAAKDISFVSKL